MESQEKRYLVRFNLNTIEEELLTADEIKGRWGVDVEELKKNVDEFCYVGDAYDVGEVTSIENI